MKMLVIESGFHSPSMTATVAHSAIRTNTATPTTSNYVNPFQKWSSGRYTALSQCKSGAIAFGIGSHKPRTTRKITMAWQDSTVRAEVDVPLSVAWELWSDREGLNRWMPWIASIKVSKDQPEMSRWTLKYNAFGQDLEFSWLARNMQPIQYQKIHWRSVDGLPNRGAVRFYPRGPSSCGIEVTVSYEVPEILAGAASGCLAVLGTGIDVSFPAKKIKIFGDIPGTSP
ncbi:uncharacterized protein LOC131063576 isoform X2 [Cryptomeria japonica]|uniref:uncharacterized protein LOC131063576 isoform X2 n=1 Tax=Cryptomeria japonica TaxID=3369 RepID=UPI0027DA0FAE|nr:uncharacterized protein LOC131063576 isoform X2 [Cryptomeria japonica]